MTSSSGTNRWSPTGTNREKIGGTLTRAKCSLPVFGLRTSTARFSDSPEMYGNGCAGSTASGVSTGKTRSLKSFLHCFCSSRVEVGPAQQLDVLAWRARARSPRGTAAAWRSISADVVLQICSSTSRGSSPDAAGTATPAAIRRLRPATRTMKNSSRLEAKIARNRTRSSSGSVRVLGELEHPGVEVQPGQLAVEEPVGLEVGGGRVVRRLDVEGLGGHRAQVGGPVLGGAADVGGQGAAGGRVGGHVLIVAPPGERGVGSVRVGRAYLRT